MSYTNADNQTLNQNRANYWLVVWENLSRNRLWQFLLVAAGSASSIVDPHAPLVGLAVVSGSTLKRERAIATAIVIWFVNQLYGYTIRQYPQTFESFAWGLLMGAGTLAVCLVSTIRPRFSHKDWKGHLLWLGLALVSGYILFQGSVILAIELSGRHGLTEAILWRIFVKDASWAIALSLVHRLIAWLSMPRKYSQTSRS
ncbi:succinyl transferase OpgC [Candidatus Gracilibacteria bacterium]|nr:succinyl transferase OpgC [Candidatus Gracilibacteria bacterium]NJM89569.1 succinyl transferase OpgC [Hydrococcus sp. RU_2_2]NJP19788.1 succinyl transferase OpgC [Hydrococcus sp. CRU_1_1]